ncbi:MAG: hypothetical protein MK008_14865 [Bdellovibrionales bacterium]|nr:hypothetical protein [Bdellovibrionales bacterium]
MLTLIFLSLQATASVLIPTPNAKSFEFKAHMYSKDYQSYTQWYLENRTQLQEELVLIELFNEAQKHFLAGDTHEALSLYLKVINMEHDRDWKKPQRDLIVDSYFQVLKLNKHNKKVYEDRLGAYVNSYSMNQASQNHDFFQPKYLNNWESILINGVHYDIKDLNQLKLYNTPYRWTLLSDKSWPHTVVATPNEFFNKHYPSSYFYSQNAKCQFNKAKGLDMDHLIFANMDCVVGPNKNKSKAKMDAAKPIKTSLKPVSLKTKKWYHSKWLWVGVSAVTGYLIYENQKGQNTQAPKPTHTEGF